MDARGEWGQFFGVLPRGAGNNKTPDVSVLISRIAGPEIVVPSSPRATTDSLRNFASVGIDVRSCASGPTNRILPTSSLTRSHISGTERVIRECAVDDRLRHFTACQEHGRFAAQVRVAYEDFCSQNTDPVTSDRCRQALISPPEAVLGCGTRSSSVLIWNEARR